jgi:predicted membrane protein
MLSRLFNVLSLVILFCLALFLLYNYGFVTPGIYREDGTVWETLISPILALIILLYLAYRFWRMSR